MSAPLSADEQLKKLQDAVEYVLNDMAYKAPEQFYDVARQRWHPLLSDALKESKS